MATMPGQNEQPKPGGQGQEPKTSETTKQQYPTGHQSPGGAPIQPGQTYETPEPKRRADDATNRQEPSKNPERAPEHQPGYEAKHQKEAKQHGKQDDANRRSQADDAAAEREAHDDLDAHHTQKANRTRPAASKQHVKRGNPALKPGFRPTKKRIRKHK